MVLQYLNCFGHGQFNKWRKGNKRILKYPYQKGRGKRGGVRVEGGGGGLTTQLRSTVLLLQHTRATTPRNFILWIANGNI
jgi:hypothetical protein